MNESKRVLSAQAQLSQLASVAAKADCRAIVLKGGVAVSGLTPLDLEDIDLLVPPAHATRFALAVDDAGYRAEGGGSPRHLTTRRSPGSLPLDVHTTTDHEGRPVPETVWANAIPTAHWDGLWRLAPANHLWNVLSHTGVDHPDRRGRIRDLLLLRHALALCNDADVQQVQARVTEHPLTDTLRSLIALAVSLTGGLRPADSFQHTAFTRYTATRLLRRIRLPQAIAVTTWMWVFAVQGDKLDRRAMWRQVTARSLAVSEHGVVSWLERRHARAGQLWRMTARLVRYLLALLMALPIAALVGFESYRAGVEIADT